MPYPESHPKFVRRLAWTSGIVAFACLIVAAASRAGWINLSEAVKFCIVGAWVFLPPIWFRAEWCWVSTAIDTKERERVKHMHDLARNLWLGLVVILVALLRIDGFKIG